MIAVVQRVSRAEVRVAGEVIGKIDTGMLVLAAVEVGDEEKDVTWMANKLATLRIFRSDDGEKYFDRDVKQASGGILLVSNFTVAADTGAGGRPSLSNAAPPERGRELFDKLATAVRALGVPVEMGRFGAEMEVEMVNSGPVTFIVENSKRKTNQNGLE